MIVHNSLKIENLCLLWTPLGHYEFSVSAMYHRHHITAILAVGLAPIWLGPDYSDLAMHQEVLQVINVSEASKIVAKLSKWRN